MEKETTFYRFLSEVRSFLSKLLKNPIKAQPTKYLQDRNFNRTKLVNVLIKRDILERHEKILDSTNSDEKDAKYTVKYKVKKTDFEKKMHRIYSQYFEKNLPEKKKEVNENTVNMPLISRPFYNMFNEKDNKNMTKKHRKRVYITESQFRMIQECINSVNRADILNEDGEGGGAADGGGNYGEAAGATNASQSGEVLTTKKKSVGPFVNNNDGFFDGTISTSAKITTRKMK